VERRRRQRGGGLERYVGVILVIASPRHRGVIVTTAACSCGRQDCGLELASSSSPCPRGPADGPASRGAQQDECLRVPEIRTSPSQPPREGQRSDRRPPTSFTMAPTASTLTPCRDADRGGSHQTRCRRRVRCRRRSQALPRGACSHCLSGAAEPQMFTCPLSPAGAMVQLRPLRRPGVSPRASRGACCRR
jgi:hypothetical protein